MDIVKSFLSFIYNIFKTLLLSVLDCIFFSKNPCHDNECIIIRLDAIGDYILFRNFIKIIKESDKFKDYKITLCGNLVWKEIAETFDKEYIDDYIWIDRKRFESDFVYRYKKMRKITANGYDIAIQPTYSREFYFGDNIIKLVSAKEKVGSTGDLSNIKKWQKKLSDRYYTKLIPAKKGIMFEFYRNKEFFENFLHTKIEITKPSLDLFKIKTSTNLPDDYAVLFIGASAECRKWSPENFAEISKYIYENYGFQITICGTEADKNDAEKIKDLLSDFKLYDFTGKTSLVDLAFVISKARLLVSNETLAPHLAVAVGVPVVVIYNGNHFGRFTPYPKEMTDFYHTCYHPIIERDLENYQKLSNSYGYGSKLDINEISPQRVIETVKSCLNNFP